MRAIFHITYKDNTKDTFVDGDFWSHQFKTDLEDRNTEYIKIGDDFVKKSEMRSIRITIAKGDTE